MTYARPRAASTLRPMRIEFFVDLETGGLDEQRDEITEVAVLGVDGAVLLHRRISIDPSAADPEALALNGYDDALWARTARPWPEVAAELAHLFDVRPRPMMVGHFIHFDHRFLAHKMRAAGFDEVVPSILVDTRALAHEHLGDALCHGSLACLAQVLGVPHGELHRATEDADVARRVYLRLRRAGPIKRLWWRARAWWMRRISTHE